MCIMIHIYRRFLRPSTLRFCTQPTVSEKLGSAAVTRLGVYIHILARTLILGCRRAHRSRPIKGAFLPTQASTRLSTFAPYFTINQVIVAEYFLLE